MPVLSELVQEWLDKAYDDELNAKSILTHKDGTPGAVCFLSQQMAEKLLKGLLVFHEREFPKMHDLLLISKLTLDMEPEIITFINDLKVINHYYIETRYPGDYPEFSWQDAEKAFSIAKKLKEFVNERFEKVE